MSVPAPSIIDTRRHQIFPTLASAEIERLRRFGALRSYGAGEALVKVGEVGPGLTIILAGEVQITQRDQSGRRAVAQHMRDVGDVIIVLADILFMPESGTDGPRNAEFECDARPFARGEPAR